MGIKTIENFLDAIAESPLLEKINSFGGIYSVDEENEEGDEELVGSIAYKN